MFRALETIEQRFESINEAMGDPKVAADREAFEKLAREQAEIRSIVSEYKKYKKIQKNVTEAKALAKNSADRDLVELAREELEELEPKLVQIEQKLRLLLLPKDPHDDKNIILEIRAGTGGEEAGLFCADLFRMYSRYAERRNFKMEILSASETGIGGYKEIIASITAKGAYSRLKFESGAHRVQRVPATEASGRIHTSACTVAILPEADEVELEIDPKDLKIDVFRASGHGGQSVNTTDSAVRITHKPTGVVVSMQDEKSQHKNRLKAMKILLARLQNLKDREEAAKRSETRKSQIGSGDRSERIRTYNFPQRRVTDHRINMTLYKLDLFLDGDIDEMIDALAFASQEKALKTGGAANVGSDG